MHAVLPIVVAVAALLAVYAKWQADRLDRLHARIDAAAAAFDAQLRVRAEAAATFADVAELPRETVARLAQAAEVAAELDGLGHDREIVENALSRALIAAATDAPEAFRPRAPGATALLDATQRASFARRFHNDAVRDALVVRRRRIVRWLHLAGRAQLPAYFEMVEPALVVSEVTAAMSPYD